MSDIKTLEEFSKALKDLSKALKELKQVLEEELEECPNGKGAVLKTV